MQRFIFPVLAVFVSVLFDLSVSATDYHWYDAERHRVVPARILMPRTETKAPVIVFSHGIGGSIECCSYLAKAWTARGFICVFVQHPGSDENIWKGKVRILEAFKESFKYNWNSRTRAEDLSFAVDRLEKLCADHPDFAERVDLEHIGVGGYDLGALAALLVAGQVSPDYGESLKDDRFTAVLAMSPPIRWMNNVSFKEIYQPITAPVLFITGTEDDGIIGPTKAIHRRIPFDSMRESTDRYLITLDGGDHRIYGGRIFSISSRNDEMFQAAIVRSSTVFWRAALNNDPKAIQAMNRNGWNSLVGIQARIERRNTNPIAVSESIVAVPSEINAAVGNNVKAD